jgi:hypothetical protein
MTYVRLGTAAGAIGLLAALAACGSSYGGHAPSGAQLHGPAHQPSAAPTAGTEHFTATTSNMSVIAAPNNSLPVKASGLFTDSGSVGLAGNGKSALLHLKNGTISMSHGPGTSRQTVDRANCHASLVESGLKYQITGGTGRYARITGSGTAELTLIAALPLVHGKCDVSQSAVPNAATETFTATGPVRY